MRLFLTVWTCALALISSSPAKTNGETQKKAILFADHNRTFYVFTPRDLATPAPLLLLLHGSGRNGMSLIGPWRALAQKEGIILVAPDSSDPLHWDYQKDSPDFLHAVLTQVETDHIVDTQRVYLFGHSAGSMYALLLAIAESEYFAATAIHAGSLAEDNFKLIPTAKRRTPISIWAGTNDALFPPAVVIATRNAFKTAGFPAELHEMAGHDHDYYRVADTVNKEAWLFLKTNRLATSPNFVTLEQFMNPIVRKDSQASPTEAKPGAELKLEPPKLFAPADWDSAKPYIDYSLPQLTASVPELKGLVAAPDQQLLAELMKKTSNKSLDLLTKMPNVISREDVTIEFGLRHQTAHQHFEYLVLRHEGEGAVTLDEYRTDKGKNEAPLCLTAPPTPGFCFILAIWPNPDSAIWGGSASMDTTRWFWLSRRFPRKLNFLGTSNSKEPRFRFFFRASPGLTTLTFASFACGRICSLRARRSTLTVSPQKFRSLRFVFVRQKPSNHFGCLMR